MLDNILIQSHQKLIMLSRNKMLTRLIPYFNFPETIFRGIFDWVWEGITKLPLTLTAKCQMMAVVKSEAEDKTIH